MATAGDRNYKFVCALDFGTTFSGYAYSSVGDKDEITLNLPWGERLGISALKTPTTVLAGSRGEFEEFGFDADFKYMKLLEGNDAKGLSWYRHFKMLLQHEQVCTQIFVCWYVLLSTTK